MSFFYYCHSSKSTGKKTGKTHRCALLSQIKIMFCIPRITFCGITMKNYVERNISSKSQTTLKYAMKMLSGSSETIIFMFLGVATIHDKHDWNWNFVVLTILFCTFFRALGKKKLFSCFLRKIYLVIAFHHWDNLIFQVWQF